MLVKKKLSGIETCNADSDDEGRVEITAEVTNDNDLLSFSDFKKLFCNGNVSRFFAHETQGFGKSYIASCQLTKTSDPILFLNWTLNFICFWCRCC